MSLNAAISGIRLAQQQLSVISTNIANVDTEGYTRKILPQSSQTVGGITIGVTAEPILRDVDLNLQRDILSQTSEVSKLEIQQRFLDQIQKYNGSPDSATTVASSLSDLQEVFSRMADSPEDTAMQREAVALAQTAVSEIRDYADLIDELRNDAQEEIERSVANMNNLLNQLSELNISIATNQATGKSTASLEDKRDVAMQKLSEEVELDFFIRGDGAAVFQNVNGVQLGDERAIQISFTNSRINPEDSYPASINPIVVGGDSLSDPGAIDITGADLNGRLGGLVELRDDILAKQQAMLDELAFQLANRFDAQGLRLFTDEDGNIPANTAPDPTNGTPVDYVGFSTEIQVNTAVVDDNSLIQQGTVATDENVLSGSNEVIRRVIEFAFGSTEYQEAVGDVDLRVAGIPSTLQETLQLYSTNQITGTSNLAGFASVTDLANIPGSAITLGGSDSFDLTFSEARVAPPLTVTQTIDLEQADLQAGATAAAQIAAEINAAFAAAPAELNINATVNTFGQLVITSSGTITIDGSGANGIGDTGLEELGLQSGAFAPIDPYFDVKIGNDLPVRIEILPGETEVDLLAKLDKTSLADEGVPGLAVEITADGYLSMRPGDDINDPTFGGDLKLTGGPFETAGNVPILEALFGDNNPVSSVPYRSETATGSGQYVGFRTVNLGPNADLNTGIISSSTLVDYGEKLISQQVSELNNIDARLEDESTFKELLARQQRDESGVNIEEELANLVLIQTVFTASARAITAVEEQFRELLNAFN